MFFCRCVHRGGGGGSLLPMNPLRSFKFRHGQRGSLARVQRKIWAAADFQNFLARPNTRRPRKKAFFSWSTRIWSSEKILKIGRGPNFSLHARKAPPLTVVSFQNQRHAHSQLRGASTFSWSITAESRPCFIACACDVHSTFKDLIIAQSAQDRVARGGELLTALSRRGQGGSFQCKTVSTASVRKGAMTKRRASMPTLFSQRNEERRVQSHRFSGRLACGEGISERNPLPRLINNVVVRRQEDVGLLRTDRPPLTLSWSSGLRILSWG